jgi:carboxypeptidase C (cathepsin A)
MQVRLLLNFSKVIVALVLTCAWVGAAHSQSSGNGRTPEWRAAPWQLPKDTTTRHVLKLPERELSFIAEAGSFDFPGSSGFAEAKIAYIAYTRGDTEPAKRSVAFIVNGGPGAASAYLNLLAAGPWLAPLKSPNSSDPILLPNAETWLDFTDLVFIDPPGTGYSRLVETNRAWNHFYSVRGDIESLSSFIQRWLKEKDRFSSPIFFVGESYGGFRGPLLARKLQAGTLKSFDGMILVSPVLDFTLMQRAAPVHSPWVNAVSLPSMAAIWAEQQETLTSDILQDVERYASGEYIADLLRGVDDDESIERIAQRMEKLIGFDPDLTRRLRGRINRLTFEREWSRKSAEAAQLQRLKGQDPYSIFASNLWKNEDRLLAEVISALKPATAKLYERYLNYRPDGRYEIMNTDVTQRWNWNNGRYAVEALSTLGEALEYDKDMQVLVTHGLMDLLTPYYATRLLINQLPSGTPKRIDFKAYPGGHMFYTRAQSRQAFRADAQNFIRGVLTARAAREQH